MDDYLYYVIAHLSHKNSVTVMVNQTHRLLLYGHIVYPHAYNLPS